MGKHLERNMMKAMLALCLLAALLAPATADCGTLTCDNTNAAWIHATAIGVLAFAIGDLTTASGTFSTAMGSETNALGDFSTAMGHTTNASGVFSTAIGSVTTAVGDFSTSMGHSITANEKESLAVSGNVHAKNVQICADNRIAAQIHPVDTTAMLDAVRQLQVVEHGHSANYCTHLGLSEQDCAAERRIGFIAQQVGTAAPHTVRSGTSLRLMKQNGKEAPVDLERVDDVQSIDVHAMLAHLVGAVQKLQENNENLQQQIEQLRQQ